MEKMGYKLKHLLKRKGAKIKRTLRIVGVKCFDSLIIITTFKSSLLIQVLKLDRPFLI